MQSLRFPILTARLTLRPFTLDDTDAAHAIYRDPDVMRFVASGPLDTIEATRKTLAGHIEHQAANGFSFWAVVEQDTGRLMGDAGLCLLGSHGPEAELGFTLARDCWGRGYGTEVARSCLHAAFSELEMDRVIAVTEHENVRSIRVLEKIGMKLQGERVAYGRNHLLFVAHRPGLG